MLGKGHTVVFQKHHLQPILAQRIVVDHAGKRVNEADNALRHRVARCSLCTEKEGLRLHDAIGIVTQLLIEVNDVQRIQKLALVFVQTLDLHIENCIGVERDTLRSSDIVGKIKLIETLDFAELIQRRRIVCKVL